MKKAPTGLNMLRLYYVFRRMENNNDCWETFWAFR